MAKLRAAGVAALRAGRIEQSGDAAELPRAVAAAVARLDQASIGLDRLVSNVVSAAEMARRLHPPVDSDAGGAVQRILADGVQRSHGGRAARPRRRQRAHNHVEPGDTSSGRRPWLYSEAAREVSGSRHTNRARGVVANGPSRADSYRSYSTLRFRNAASTNARALGFTGSSGNNSR